MARQDIRQEVRDPRPDFLPMTSSSRRYPPLGTQELSSSFTVPEHLSGTCTLVHKIISSYGSGFEACSRIHVLPLIGIEVDAKYADL
jgi:hypothetical protein